MRRRTRRATNPPGAAPAATADRTPADATVAPAPAAGILAREEGRARDAIRRAMVGLGLPNAADRFIDLRALPFAGTWGAATTVARALASDLVTAELQAAGETEGLSKKELKRRVNERIPEDIAAGRGVDSRRPAGRPRRHVRFRRGCQRLRQHLVRRLGDGAQPDRRGHRRGRPLRPGRCHRRARHGRAQPAQYPQGLPRRPPAQHQPRRRRQPDPGQGRLPGHGRDLHRRHRPPRHPVPVVLRAVPPRPGAGRHPPARPLAGRALR